MSGRYGRPFLLALGVSTIVAVTLAVSSLAPAAHADPGSLTWSKVYDGPGEDEFRAVVPAPKGGVFVAGDSSSPVSTLVARYSAAGNRAWLRAYTGPGSSRDLLFDAAADGRGGLLAVGDQDNAFLVLRYTARGKRSWARTYDYPRSSAEEAYHVAVDAAGNVYVSGGTQAGTGTMILVKYSPKGVRRWARHYSGGGMGSWVNDMAVDRAGDAYLTGQHLDAAGRSEGVTVKFDAAGHRRWVRFYGRSESDSALGIVATRGGLYVAGYTQPTASPYTLPVVIKYSATGALKWSRTHAAAGTGQDSYYEIVALPGGDVVAAGSSTGLSVDALVVRLSPRGGTRWAKTLDDALGRLDTVHDVVAGPSGTIYATGATDGATTGLDALTLSYGRAGDFRWATPYVNQGANDQQRAMAITVNGGVYVVGSQAGATFGAVLLKYVP